MKIIFNDLGHLTFLEDTGGRKMHCYIFYFYDKINNLCGSIYRGGPINKNIQRSAIIMKNIYKQYFYINTYII